MYKRKFPKTKPLLGNVSTSTQKPSTSSTSSIELPTASTISRHYSTDNSPPSPSFLDELPELPLEKKRKTIESSPAKSDFSEPLFENNSFSYLKHVLLSCGLHLKSDQNILSVEEYKFIQKLKSELTADSEDIGETDHVRKFYSEFEAYYSDKVHLKIALTPCKVVPENKLRPQRDSLTRLLLQIPQLQTNLIDFLFDKMAEISLEDPSENVSVTIQIWVRLLLKPFKQLYCIIDLKKVILKLFDNLNVMPDIDLKRELILSIPDIVLDREDHDAHDELCKLLRNDKDLMACILETIGQLTISKEDLAFIQMDMIPEIHHTPSDILPALVRFLIKVNDRLIAEKIVNGLRCELPFGTLDKLSQSALSDNLTSIQLVIFSCIYDRFLSCKMLLDVWVKIISQIQSHVEHKSLDVVILFLAYSSASNDSSTKTLILSVFKERIKNRFFHQELMEKTFKIFTPVFKQYFESFIDLFSNLLKVTDHISIEVVTSMVVNCFINIDQCWCKWIVDELLVLMGTGNKLTVEIVLNILMEFTKQRIDKIQPLATRLISVFINKIYDFSTKEISQVMDMLCKVAYSEGPDGINNCSVFQDEINIFVQKELCSIDIISQRVGIIGAIMLIKHIVNVSSDEDSQSISTSEEIIPLSQKAREAYSLIELLVTRTQANTDSQILFFDQFAIMLFQSPYLDKTFMHTVSSVMKKNFQYSFLIAANEFNNENLMIDCSLTFCLDKDLDEIIAVNISPIVMNEFNKIDSAILGLQSCRPSALTSMFRLVRGLEREDLSEIDALLGCPIVLPSSQTIENFEMLSPEQQIIVVNSLFHTVNWFHEVINCFSYLFKQKNGNKVLIRLRTITYLIKIIKKCLSIMYDPEYIPPLCYYGLNVEKPNFNKNKKKSKIGKNTKKREKKVKESANISVNTTSGTNFNITRGNYEENEQLDTDNCVDIKIYKDYFRELDIDTWLILTQKFVINPDPEKDKEFSPELGPSEFCYLMEDVIEKLDYIVFKNKRLSPLIKIKSKETVGFNSVSLVPEKTMLRNFIKLLPHLFTDLEILSEFFKNLLLVNDNILDSTGMFMNESVYMKQCVGLILKSIVILFQWKDFESSDTEDLLINALKKMTNKNEFSQSTQSRRPSCKKSLLSEKIIYLRNFQEIILHLEAAVSLVTLIQLLKTFSNDAENDIILREICWIFLTRQWYTLKGAHEEGPKYNDQIKFLLDTFLQCHENKLDKLVEIVDWLEQEVMVIEAKTDRLKTLPTINKMNLKCLINVILNSLLGSVKNCLKSSDSEYDRLIIWQSTIYVMEKVVHIVKKQDSRTNLLVFVKGSILLLKLFLVEGMSICQHLFKIRIKEVSKVLKNLQVITRYMQNICNYTKVVKDNALSNHLPNIRGILETLILKVKNVMVLNGCTDALFMGIMKNMDIKGEEILSQNDSSEDDDDNDDDDDDEQNKSDKNEANDLANLLNDDSSIQEHDSDADSSIL